MLRRNYPNQIVGEMPCRVGVLHFDDEVATSAYDDVFHLDAVKVHWCFLPFADDQEFFCAGPLVWAPPNAVPQAEQNEAAFLEPPCAEVRDVPSHLMCAAERGDVRNAPPSPTATNGTRVGLRSRAGP